MDSWSFARFRRGWRFQFCPLRCVLLNLLRLVRRSVMLDQTIDYIKD